MPERASAAAALRFILAGAALGAAIPLLLRLASAAMESLPGVPVAAMTFFDSAQLLLWPTPLLLVPVEEPGAPDLSAWGAVAIAALANVTLYATLAGLVWLGLAKSRWILAFPLLIVAGIWTIVLRT
jgi:hypothetical protein